LEYNIYCVTEEHIYVAVWLGLLLLCTVFSRCMVSDTDVCGFLLSFKENFRLVTLLIVKYLLPTMPFSRFICCFIYTICFMNIEFNENFCISVLYYGNLKRSHTTSAISKM
jgi:hypothetical protein